MNDKLKFYRSTLVQLTKGLIGYTPMHKLAEDADKVAKEIMKKVDEYENSFNYQTQVNENHKFCTTITGSLLDHLGFEGNKQKANLDYLKTEPIRTIVDHGPQYQPNQKPYGTLGEHWKELMVLFEVKNGYANNWKSAFNTIIKNYKEHGCASIILIKGSILKPIVKSLGIEFIEDFVKACEKCEE